MDEMRNAYRILVENIRRRDHAEDIGLDGMIISEWTLGKEGGKLWTAFIWFRTGISGELL